MIFIVEREIIKNLLVLHIHAAQTVGDDDGEFKAERGIVRQARRHRAREQQAVAVLMLEAFTIQRGSSGSCAEQKSFRSDVTGQPEQITNALRTEHRVVNVKRNRRHAMRGVARAGGDEGSHRTGFGDALFKNLAVFGFVVERQDVFVHWLVKLAFG